MDTSANLGSLLKFYAKKKENAFIPFPEFYEYVKKYAARHIGEQPNLVKYLNAPEQTVLDELKALEAEKEVLLSEADQGKPVIAVISYYADLFAGRYSEIIANPAVQFPVAADLPKQLPVGVLRKDEAEHAIPALFERQNTGSRALYCLTLPRGLPAILFPESVPANILTRAAMAKIRHLLRKDEAHDYFMKKLTVANPGKAITGQKFFASVVQHPDGTDQEFELNSDDFYFLTQLLFFIRQDYEKVKDRTAEDTNILQAVAITEIDMMSRKEKISREHDKEIALRELENALMRPPYFFSMDGILKLTDSKGALLYGQYGEDDLKAFLQKLTTESADNELPKILVVKAESGTRYFIYKQKVFPLVIRLANEAHDTIEKNIVDKWHRALAAYEKLPEMREQKKFEEVLRQETKKCSPVLYALLNANFLTMLQYEDGAAGSASHSIFSGGKLIPYSDILMLRDQTILAKARAMLPFWYKVPFLSWLTSLFAKKPKQKQDGKQKDGAKAAGKEEAARTQDSGRAVSKRTALAETAKTVAGTLIPEGSTIDRELDSYLKQWNKLITTEAHVHLTEDVNRLIRDYTRSVIKSVTPATLTQERVRYLAETLVRTPNMKKIRATDALYMYVQLYILRLISNG